MSKNGLGAILSITGVMVLAICTLLFVSPFFSSKSSKGMHKTVTNSGGDASVSGVLHHTDQIAIEDLLAVACNIVRGKVLHIAEITDSDGEQVRLVEFEVTHVYGSDLIIYERKDVIRFTYGMYSEDTLRTDDECIVVISDAKQNHMGTDITDPDLSYDYIVAEPKYSVMQKTDSGYLAERFMKAAGAESLSSDGMNYKLQDVESIIRANTDKLKSLSLLQLIPPN